MTVRFRLADLEDRPGNTERHFIVDSWVSSYQDAHAAGMIAAEDWFPTMIRQVSRLLAWPDVQTIVAYEPDETTKLADLYGFIAGDVRRKVPLVYYVFVKEPYRKGGYARSLLAALGIDPRLPFHYACKTGVVTDLSRKIPCAKWRPEEARYSKNDQHRRQQTWPRR